MIVELHHATGDCMGTFTLCGVVNQHLRCGDCCATYNVMVRGHIVYLNEVLGTAMLEEER